MIQGRRNDFGIGGQRPRIITLIFQEDTILNISIIYDFQYPLSYEHFLALFLYTDLYVVVLILLNFLGWQLPPPPATPCSYSHVIKYNLLKFNGRKPAEAELQ